MSRLFTPSFLRRLSQPRVDPATIIFGNENAGQKSPRSSMAAAVGLFPGNSMQASQQQTVNNPLIPDLRNVSGREIPYRTYPINFSFPSSVNSDAQADGSIVFNEQLDLIDFHYCTTNTATPPTLLVKFYRQENDWITFSPGFSMRGWGCNRFWLKWPGGIGELGEVLMSFAGNDVQDLVVT